MNDLSTRIETALRREAESVTSATGFSSDDIVRAGRSAVRRRRGVTAVAAAVAVIAIAAGGYAALPAPEAAPRVTPADSPSPQHPPGPENPAPSPGADVSALGFAVFAGNVLERPDGQRVTLPLEPDLVISVHRAVGGWVVDGPGELWWVPEAGPAVLIGDYGAPVLSADGQLVVASGPDSVVAVALPSLADRGGLNQAGRTLAAVGVSGDQVLLRDGMGGAGPSDVLVWNLATAGMNQVSGPPVWAWGMSADGLVLRRVDRSGEDAGACIDVVPLSDGVLPVDETGMCGPEAAATFFGEISPDGDWVYLIRGYAEAEGSEGGGDDSGQGSGLSLHATAALQAGLWEPVELVGISGIAFWDGDTFVAAAGDPNDGYYRCDVTGACEPLSLPTHLGPYPVPILD